MNKETFLSLGLLIPELTILMTVIVLFLIHLFTAGAHNKRLSLWLALVGVVISLLFTLNGIGSPVTTILAGTYRMDAVSTAFKLLMLISTVFVLILSTDSNGINRKGLGNDFYCLMLTALLGAMMLTSSADMITLFVSLEILALSSYIMVGLGRQSPLAGETSFKFFVNGGIATGITLFGMSYLYGFTGTTNMYGMSLVLNTANHNSLIFSQRYLLVFLFIILFVGLSYKFSSMWTPDVYENAPIPAVAFFSIISKMAGFTLVLRFFLITFMNAPGIYVSPTTGPVSIFITVKPYIAAVAALAMLFGNIAALRQKNVKRLFAYSSIAQAGYILIPFVSLTQLTLPNIWFYLLAYLFMNLGALAVIQMVIEKEHHSSVQNLSGLFYRSPWGALAMAVFLISLAGVPFTAGYIGKYDIFVQAWSTGHDLLAIVMVGATVISCFYYLRMTVKLFIKPHGPFEKFSVPTGIGFILTLSVIATFGFGLFPNLAFDFLYDHFQLADFFKTSF